MILRENASIVAGGAAAGLLLAWVFSPLLAPLLLHVDARDAGMVSAIFLALTVVGLAACFFPALSAAQDQAADVLREF